jgi:hypothetical protein
MERATCAKHGGPAVYARREVNAAGIMTEVEQWCGSQQGSLQGPNHHTHTHHHYTSRVQTMPGYPGLPCWSVAVWEWPPALGR